MTKPEHIALLQQGKDKWNSWRAEHQDVVIDLSGTILFRANLYKANLSRANLSGTVLVEADLNGADLGFADLIGTDLTGANLYRADLTGANLREANLREANLKEAIAWGTHFINIDLRSVKGLETIDHRGPSYISTCTLERSEGDIPDMFLRRAGLSDPFIEYVHALLSHPIQYYTCFISYSSKDQKFAERLYADLQSNGIRCWYAPEDLDIGDKFRQKIDESIRMYDKLLLVLSQHSITSTWVEYEVERALNKEPQGIPNVLYPVRMDDSISTCTTLWAKDIQSTRHIGDFTRWKEHDPYQKSFQRLLRALQQKDPRPSK